MNICGVCLENVGNKNCCTTECGHQFHLKCMSKITKCPICRFQLIEEDADEKVEINNEDQLIASIYSELKESELKEEINKIIKNGWDKNIVEELYEKVEGLSYDYDVKYDMNVELAGLLLKLKVTLNDILSDEN